MLGKDNKASSTNLKNNRIELMEEKAPDQSPDKTRHVHNRAQFD